MAINLFFWILWQLRRCAQNFKIISANPHMVPLCKCTILLCSIVYRKKGLERMFSMLAILPHSRQHKLVKSSFSFNWSNWKKYSNFIVLIDVLCPPKNSIGFETFEKLTFIVRVSFTEQNCVHNKSKKKKTNRDNNIYIHIQSTIK